MQLRSLHLKNFRSFLDETIWFEPPLTVLVGENNGGKSNLVDAIRLISTPLSGRRELYCEPTDVRFGSASASFELAATFDGLSSPQQGRLLSATTDDTLTEAKFGLTYDAGKPPPSKPSLWAGRFKAVPEAGCHEAIRHVYLPPLRDAKRALASGNPTRIYALLSHFLGERKPDEVAQALARAASDPILTDVDKAVAIGLDVLTTGVRRQTASLGFNRGEKLIDIARDLRFRLADHGVLPEDLQYSGLGLANLLYMATIAVELEKTDSAELTLFLVEEPEAHLHPQLQAAVLNFLEERAVASLKPKSNPSSPAGHLQVIVATHSPNLSAWVASQSLVLVRSIHETPAGTPVAPPADAVPVKTDVPRAQSRAIPFAKLNLSSPERRKIDRYLDVTKSSLLFGGRALLVEGIAEALILPVIAKHHVLKSRPTDLRVFRAAVFVPIDGVDFDPYVKALLTPFNGIRIADRLVIVTDGDKQTVAENENSPGDLRKAKLEAFAKGAEAASVLHVVANTYSLETELIAAGNEDLMKQVYLTLHPQSSDKWDAALQGTADERARNIQGIFKTTPKGDFAQLLADLIVSSDSFKTPDYLRAAIEAVVQ